MKAQDFIGWISPDENLKVVDIAGKDGNNSTLFKVTCKICHKDKELYPEDFYTEYKGNLLKGVKRCGCSKHPMWTKEQYLVLAKRKSQGRFKVLGLNEDFKGQNTKVNCVCLLDGYIFTPTFNNIINKNSGCPKCGDTLKKDPNIAENDCIKICNELGYEPLGFDPSYKNRHSKFKYICAQHGIHRISYTNLVKGRKCPGCRKEERKKLSGFYGLYDKRLSEEDYLYIMLFSGQYFKVGRSFNVPKRLQQVKFESKINDVKIYKVFKGIHKNVYEQEQKLHAELIECGYEHTSSLWSTETFKMSGLPLLEKLLAKTKLLQEVQMKQIKSTLYALNKDGSFQEWKVFTMNNQVIVEFGKMGGKIQQKITQCEGKNVGRSNETTCEQQAILEAHSKWEKQVRLGYRESIDQLETEENLSPMLAQDAIKRSRDIIYPCFVQPKLDGLRCLVTFDANGVPVFNSRGNKTYPIQGDIPIEIKSLKSSTGFEMFDGEVYLHGLSLQKIVSLAKKWRTHEQINQEIEKDYQADRKRRQKALEAGEPTYKNFNKDDVDVSVMPEPDSNRYGGYESADLMFSIFDIPSKGKIWDSNLSKNDISFWDYDANPCRYADLMNTDHWISALSLQKINIVHGNQMKTESEVKESIGFYMTNGYEGAIIRNYVGLYEFGQRSTNLQKWKIFQDSEAKVIDYTIDKNKEAVLHCVEKDGTKFKCKMKGTFLDRNENAAKKIVDKFINFTFQQRSEDGVPIFPVGQFVREVNPVTWQPIN